ncbi:MAG: M48 family metalloprotease [Flammeovirgaceae bacterium]|nr:M48 family metalloprotease [Flammeovirgaceae bacterium]
MREAILSMARANSVPADNVYEFDASKQSDRISANVSGIGSTIRVSLNDNLLNRCTPEEVKAVMGHELGHYVLNHGPEDLIYFSLIIIIGFAFVNWSFQNASIHGEVNGTLKTFLMWLVFHCLSYSFLPIFF